MDSTGRIKNCVIEGFDHGILAAGNETTESQPEDRGRIEGNRVDARFVAIHLAEADNFDVRENKSVWRTRGGVGILIHHNADAVEIRDNEIFGDFPALPAPIQGAVLMPGPSSSSNPVYNQGHGAILVLQTLGTHPQLFTAIINETIRQFRASESATVDDSFTEDTLVERNSIKFRSDNNTEDGIVASNTRGTFIRGNIIGNETGDSSVRQAIRAGALNSVPGGSPRLMPERCTGNEDRYCLSDFDCNIPGVDEGQADTCPARSTQGVFWIPQDLLYEDNQIYGPFQSAMATTGNISIRGNSVYGRLPAGITENFGITLAGKYPLEASEVSRNQISDVVTAVRLMNVFGGESPAFFGVKFSLNDITGYTKAVLTSNDYALASELSTDPQGNVCGPDSTDCRGNYWGLSCPLGFDPALVRKDNGGAQPAVVDSFPYPEPVAEVPDELLPEICE